jgi:hypothetical protein
VADWASNRQNLQTEGSILDLEPNVSFRPPISAHEILVAQNIIRISTGCIPRIDIVVTSIEQRMTKPSRSRTPMFTSSTIAYSVASRHIKWHPLSIALSVDHYNLLSHSIVELVDTLNIAIASLTTPFSSTYGLV